MKNIYVTIKTALFILILITLSTTASAQSVSKSEDNKGYFTLVSSFDMPRLKGYGDDPLKLKGFTAGLVGSGGELKIPLHIDCGLLFSGAYYSEKERTILGDVKEKFSYYSMAIPLGVSYRLSVADRLTVVPSIGTMLRVGITGEAKISLDEQEVSSVNIFDDGDIADRFTAGFYMGIAVEYSRVSLGFKYLRDFMDTAMGLRYSSLSISLGVRF